MATSSRDNKLFDRLQQPFEQQYDSIRSSIDDGIETKYNQNSAFQRNTNFLNAQPVDKSQLGKFSPRTWSRKGDQASCIKWDMDRGIRAATALDATRDLDVVKRYYPEAYESAHLMLTRLEFHREHFSPGLPDPYYMVSQSLATGPAFAEQYSDQRKLGRFAMLGLTYVSDPPHIPFAPMKGFDDAYNPAHFIFWEEDSEDYLWMLRQNLSPPDPEMLEDVRRCCADISKELLSDEEIGAPVPKTAIFMPVSSGSFDPLAGKSMPNWEVEYDSPEWDYEEPRMIAKRSLAPKRPGETRDIGVLTPASMHRHRRFMFFLQMACRRIRGCPYGQDMNKVSKIVDVMSHAGPFYYMRDYTKSGMTVPHPVIRAVFEGFYERRPDYAEMASSWYEKGQLYFSTDMECPSHPTSGAPLGLWVEGYTLLQYAIHRINKASLSFKTTFSATNDDMVIGFRSLEQCISYIDIDIVTNSNLGMAYKDTKSGWAKDSFVYCEEYVMNGKRLDKSSLYAGAVLGGIKAVNIVQAKQFVHSVLLACPSITPEIELATNTVINAFEAEFDERESRWPYLFGGWLPQVKDGVDYSYDWYNGDLIASAAYWAARQTLRKENSLSTDPHLVIGRVLGIRLLNKPSGHLADLVDLIPFFGSKKTMKRHYMKAQNHPRTVANQYQALYDLRQKAFCNYLNAKWELPSVTSEWLIRHPNSVIRTSMPGLKFKKCVKILPVRTGLPNSRLDMKLHLLAKTGHIDWISDIRLRPTHIRMICDGITGHTGLVYLTEDGALLSSHVSQLKGLLPLAAEKNLTISSFYGDSKQILLSRAWIFSEHPRVVDLYRLHDLLGRKMGGNMDTQEAAMQAADLMDKYHAQRLEDEGDEEEPEPPEPDSKLLEIAEYILGSLRVVGQDSDSAAVSFLSRISGSVRAENADGAWTNQNLYPKFSEDGTREGPTNDNTPSEPSTEESFGGDVWDDLDGL
jgi:hypothetical protein